MDAKIKQKYVFIHEFIKVDLLNCIVAIIIFMLLRKTDYINAYLILIIIFIVYTVIRQLVSAYCMGKSEIQFYDDCLYIIRVKNFRKKVLEVPYDEISYVLYYQSDIQKLCGLSDIIIETKSRNIFKKNIVFHSVSNNDPGFKKLKEIF